MATNKSIIHSRKFRIRYYESDLNGLLSCPNYLRFMQETAFDASSAAGYDWKRYQKINRIWVIRDTEIHAIKPVYYDQILLAKTWISDFHGITSRREYAFYRLDSKLKNEPELVAEGYSDWVFLDTQKARPVIIPFEIKHEFFPDGIPETFPRHKRFTLNNKTPDNPFTQQIRISLRDIDQLQHMNNASYLDYAIEINLLMFEQTGISFQNLQKKQMHLLPHFSRIRYKTPAHYGDTLIITSWVSKWTNDNLTTDFLIRRESDNTLLVQGQLGYIYFNLATQSPNVFPLEIIEILRK